MTTAPAPAAADVAADVAFGTFFLPGPTEVRPEVLAAMTRPMITHRGKAFEAIFARAQAGLREVFKTSRPVFVSTSASTGLMEAAVRNAPPGPVLSVVNGAFSERFAHIARACGREVDALEIPLGRVATADDVAARLRARRYAAMTVVHSESSTGALTDVTAVAAAARDAGVACLIDSVTGVGGAPLHTDAAGLDFVLTGSQKALALPPGLSFCVASEAYMRAAADAPHRGMYFDLVEFEEFAAKNQTPNTPAISLIYALEVQMARVVAETIEARWARHAAMAEQTYRWVDERAERFGLGVLAPAGERSPTVTAITLPERISGDDVVKGMAARGLTIGSGYGPVRRRSFRIGHMGDHTPDGIARCLEACDSVLERLLG
jgi:aspartate aminotransferase-like enzyme